MLSEVEVTNKISLDRKQDKLRHERDEDLKIVRYNANRIAKEESDAAEAQRLKEDKELEI